MIRRSDPEARVAVVPSTDVSLSITPLALIVTLSFLTLLLLHPFPLLYSPLLLFFFFQCSHPLPLQGSLLLLDFLLIHRRSELGLRSLLRRLHEELQNHEQLGHL